METSKEQMDRELLIRLDEKVGIFLVEFKNYTLQVDARLKLIESEKASSAIQKDHEARIRRLEYFTGLGLGVVFALEFYFKFFS